MDGSTGVVYLSEDRPIQLFLGNQEFRRYEEMIKYSTTPSGEIIDRVPGLYIKYDMYFLYEDFYNLKL